MKLRFDPSLPHQIQAIESVVRIFEGLAVGVMDRPNMGWGQSVGLFESELGLGNALEMDEAALLQRLREVQAANGITPSEALDTLNFSVEMETGTGKTYVYLRTAFELNARLGLSKFVIVVPSIAVREGVLQSLASTEGHFKQLYGGVPYSYFAYDSAKPGRVRQFCDSNHVQFMVINIQAFIRDAVEAEDGSTEEAANLIHRETDRLSGRKPIEFIQAVRPVVIIDEPQSVDSTENARRAIAKLSPLFTLRYSATHRVPYNLVYRLDPVEAYERRLVKQIEVASVVEDGEAGAGYVRLLEVDAGRRLRARLEFVKLGRRGPRRAKAWVKPGDDLWRISGGLDQYRHGFIVSRVRAEATDARVAFSGGIELQVGSEIGGYGPEVIKAQIHETVEQHLQKELLLQPRGIKVLSLFFVDRVANYREYRDDGSPTAGQYAEWFEAALAELLGQPQYAGVLTHPISELHGGYFSKDRRGRVKDTRGSSRDDEDTYSVIMRDKSRLLDPDEPLRFIFSHSALREGWDNPNVFQICTLNESRSAEKKRQEIGRGLRLPVDREGRRIHDDDVNRLTVVANSTYDEFARSLQTELEEDFGIDFARVSDDAFRMLRRGAEMSPIGLELSQSIWRHLVSVGVLDSEGRLGASFDPRDPSLSLHLPPDLADLSLAVLSVLRKRHITERVRNARERKRLELNESAYRGDLFRALWSQISPRTRYRMAFDTAVLTERAVAAIAAMPPIQAPLISVSVVDLEVSSSGVTAGVVRQFGAQHTSPVATAPDLVGQIHSDTRLTRRTISEILRRSDRLDEFKVNPSQFIARVSGAIRGVLSQIAEGGVSYSRIDDEVWEQERIRAEAALGLTRYVRDLYQVRSVDKALFDAVECDSETERRFAEDLDMNAEVKFFVKLPRWFRIDTPVGAYNPDWALAVGSGDRVYLVTETKSTLVEAERRVSENEKLVFGRMHFEALGVDFDVVTSLGDLLRSRATRSGDDVE